MTNESENPGNRDKNEKKNWFHSLSRRKKSQNPDLNGLVGASTNSQSTLTSAKESTTEDSTSSNAISSKERKRKDERKNVFQRLKKRLSGHFVKREKKTSPDSVSSNSNGLQTEDVCVYSQNDLSPVAASSVDPPEMIPFSHKYRKFVMDKWSENGLHPNRVMYNACLEMLGQVWYWGEISRDDAQRHLKDKDNGSFLVRDSESGGSPACRYTLSFRNSNCTLHYRLEYRQNYWHFEALQYESIVEMIEDILHRCMRDHFVCFVRVPDEIQPRLHVVLKYPISRYSKIMKLQDLCRRVIQLNFSEEDIQNFEIPVKLQKYLGEKCQLVFQSL